MAAIKYKYHSLDDFLVSHPLTVDGELDDGWGATFPVKGREIDATILFSDITAFSKRTFGMSPTEQLIFANTFFCWMSAEALRGSHGIVDKYIGDELMIVFSKGFGSTDPFEEALQAGRWMGTNDVLDFHPHIGIASGPVLVGYVGTPIKYNCSVFGAAVVMASRCARVELNTTKYFSTTMVFPACEWNNRDLGTIFPPIKYRGPGDHVQEQPHGWELLSPWKTALRNLPETEVMAVANPSMRINNFSVEDRTKRSLEYLKRAKMYRGKA
jgi:hypothetical protein